ncbi:MAG: ABC transporter permease [Ardenticatenaceae bacterium]|nr:ABC transporter permease [Ardenticatenaceae bacterium]MCB9443187.1 ABC transporter permease [Ardenticatenaceae bacterium]
MLQFISRRIISTIFMCIAIAYFGFLGMRLIERTDADEPEFSVAEAFSLAGEDALQLAALLRQGTLGMTETIAGPRPISEILWFSYKNSLGLLLIALLNAGIIGLLVGTLAALGKRKWRTYVLLLITIVGISAPSYLIALLLQQAGILYTVNFGRRLVSMGGFAWDFQHMAMPLLVLAARPVAYLTRSSYISLGRIMEEDYIRTALAKGLTRSRTVWIHAFGNLAIPLLTAVGVSIRFSLSALPLVEYIFAWPGVGQRILEAINERNALLVVVIALAIGLTIQLISFLLDFTYYFVDPRVRERT